MKRANSSSRSSSRGRSSIGRDDGRRKQHTSPAPVPRNHRYSDPPTDRRPADQQKQARMTSLQELVSEFPFNTMLQVPPPAPRPNRIAHRPTILAGYTVGSIHFCFSGDEIFIWRQTDTDSLTFRPVFIRGEGD